MNLSTCANDTDWPSNTTAQTGLLQASSYAYSGGMNISPAVYGNRLYRPIEIVPKHPAYLLGELVVRPLLDCGYGASVYTFRAVKRSMIFLNNIATQRFVFFPGATASATALDKPKEIECPEEKILRTVFDDYKQKRLKDTQFPKTLPNGKESVPESKNSQEITASATALDKPNVPELENSQEIVDNRSEITPEEARKILLEGTEDDTKMRCAAEREIEIVRALKKPDKTEQHALASAYNRAKYLINTNGFVGCHELLIGLLDEIKSDAHFYSIKALYPLPDLLQFILKHESHDSTYIDIALILKKINDIARHMLSRLQVSVDEEMISLWSDIMLQSCKKNPALLVDTLETVLDILQKNAENSFTDEQITDLRVMARTLKNGSNKEHQALAGKILDLTGPQVTPNFIYTPLEFLPAEIRKLNQRVKDIGVAIIQTETFQTIALTSVWLSWSSEPVNFWKVANVLLKSVVVLGVSKSIIVFLYNKVTETNMPS